MTGPVRKGGLIRGLVVIGAARNGLAGALATGCVSAQKTE